MVRSVYPFEQSSNLLSSLVGLMLSLSPRNRRVILEKIVVHFTHNTDFFCCSKPVHKTEKQQSVEHVNFPVTKSEI